MRESLILVDPYGRRTGTAERTLCHQGEGMRHRAFVVFLLSKEGKVLVQKRAASKLGGDRWDVSATSHVRAKESYGAAIRRCLQAELGIDEIVTPRYQLSYLYHDQIGAFSEFEYCSLFLVDYEGPLTINRDEMDEVRWLSVAELEDWSRRDSKQFTRWFDEAFRRLVQRH